MVSSRILGRKGDCKLVWASCLPRGQLIFIDENVYIADLVCSSILMCTVLRYKSGVALPSVSHARAITHVYMQLNFRY